jgi:hypothetical protein
MQNPDPASPATPRVAAQRRHDTVWNSIVTSVPSFETGRFPAIGRNVRNCDIGDVRSNQVLTHKRNTLSLGRWLLSLGSVLFKS